MSSNAPETSLRLEAEYRIFYHLDSHIKSLVLIDIIIDKYLNGSAENRMIQDGWMRFHIFYRLTLLGQVGKLAV
jgi:hypothetical protein